MRGTTTSVNSISDILNDNATTAVVKPATRISLAHSSCGSDDDSDDDNIDNSSDATCHTSDIERGHSGVFPKSSQQSLAARHADAVACTHNRTES